MGKEDPPAGGGTLSRHGRAACHPRRCGSRGMWGAAEAAGAAPKLGWAAWGCAGSSPVPPADIPPPDFKGAGENVGNSALVMLSCKNSCHSRFVGPGEFAHELTSS